MQYIINLGMLLVLANSVEMNAQVTANLKVEQAQLVKFKDSPLGEGLRVLVTAAPEDFGGKTPNDMRLQCHSAMGGWYLIGVHLPPGNRHYDQFGTAPHNGTWYQNNPDPPNPLKVELVFEKMELIASEDRKYYNMPQVVDLTVGNLTEKVKELLRVQIVGRCWTESMCREERLLRAVTDFHGWCSYGNQQHNTEYDPAKGIQVELWGDVENESELRAKIEALAKEHGVKLEPITKSTTRFFHAPYFLPDGGTKEISRPKRTDENP